MRKIMRSVVCVAVISLVAGCASTKQYVRLPDQTKALENPELCRIYVIRPSIVGGAIPMSVRDDNKLIGSTGPKGYLCWEREPGKTKLSSKAENTSSVELDAKKGSDYYFTQYVRMGFFIARTKLELIDETKGQEMLKFCKPPTITSP
jgi:hypothetical protein